MSLIWDQMSTNAYALTLFLFSLYPAFAGNKDPYILRIFVRVQRISIWVLGIAMISLAVCFFLVADNRLPMRMAEIGVLAFCLLLYPVQALGSLSYSLYPRALLAAQMQASGEAAMPVRGWIIPFYRIIGALGIVSNGALMLRLCQTGFDVG